MLVIRLFRVGKKNQPSFRVVVTDRRNPPRAGRYVEEVGFWNPITKERTIKKERVSYWLSVGAKPSPAVFNILLSEKIVEGKKIPLHKKSKRKKEKEGSPEAAEPEAKKEEKPVAEEKPATEEKPAASQPTQPAPAGEQTTE